MISIIITAYKEEKTVGKAINSFLKQKIKDKYEILVVCPDKATKEVVKIFSKRYKQVKYIQDPGKGKPLALNTAFKKAKGDIFVLTDGDVYVGDKSVNCLLDKLKNPKVGAVAGRPVSINPKDNIFGYWSQLLTEAAHTTRLERTNKGKFIVCSGYLFAMHNLFNKIPEDALSDDAVMSHMVRKRGYKIDYAPGAKVYVKYPTNYKDWILQKRRSAGGYNQIKRYFGKVPRMRNFIREAYFGWYKAITYPSNLKELCWTLALFPVRLWLWIVIFFDITLRKKKFNAIWRRIETTK